MGKIVMDPNPNPDPADPTAPRAGVAAGLGRWVRALYTRALGLAALALLAYFVFVQPPPFWPFVTGGRIYVESPGVYTRERLVNDRYSQDFWLKSQLTLLDSSKDLLREHRYIQLQGGPAGAPAPEPDRVVLAFQDEFLLRGAIRDKVRQMILENLLDDRHDLTGNSIYGLKFETAVVPGSNTYRRPYVIVRIEAETLPEGKIPSDLLAETGAVFDTTRKQYNGWRRNVEGRLNGYIEQAVKSDACDAGEPAASDAPLQAAAPDPEAQKAGMFVSDPEGTAVATSAAPRDDAGATEAEDGWSNIDRGSILASLRHVLGVEPREVSFADWLKGGSFGTIEIPEPWSRYFQIQVWRNPDQGLGEAGCGDRFNVQLKPVFAAVLLVDRDRLEAFIERASERDNRSVLMIGTEVADKQVLIYQQQLGTLFRASEAERTFVGSLTEADLGKLRTRAGTAPPAQCLVAASEEMPAKDGGAFVARGECMLEGERHIVEASFYDFLRAIAQSVPYSYAVFPRGDVEGVLTDRTLGAGLEAPGASNGALGLSGLMRSREVGAEPVVVNFAGGRSHDVAAGDFDFGWAIVRPGRQRASQVSQLVLVSVPAYLDKLDLWVETGWLDRNSNPIGPPPVAEAANAAADPTVEERYAQRQLMRMTVALPPDYEAIDTLVVGGTRRQGPVINDLYFEDRDLIVTACRNAEMLIPGERLWRSTSVTLGGQTASKITVMPDMRGIVASFEPVGIPAGAQASDVEVEETLAVWTSEGRDEAPPRVRIRIPAEVAGQRACPPLPVRE